jgi:CHAT domain-containing protein
VKSAVGGSDVLHMSVHGEFNGEEPLLSYLALASGNGDDGHLTAAEMFGLPLAKTRLVVLSACETARVEVGRSNEVLGIVRALLYAGAGALVLSYWRVDADSTALWMETFHRAAQTTSLGEAAQRALMAVKATPQFAHPYYWGAFSLVARQ